MRKIFSALVLLLALALVLWIALPMAYNQEQHDMDAQARLSATGAFAELSAGITHYELSGPASAQIVVLVHGFSVPAYIWEPTFQMLLKAGYQVLRYDLYGRGYSDRPTTDYTGQLFDQQLTELLDFLNVRAPVDIIGLSMGGAIATDFATHHPERVRKLALVDPAHRGREERSLMDMALVGEFIMDVSLSPGMAEGQTTDFVEPGRFPDWADKYRVQMTYRGFKAAILSTLRNYFHEDHWAAYLQVGAFQKPVLLIWGKQDATIPFSMSKAVQEALNAQFLAVDNAGHLPHYERPEVVNPVLLEFLAD